MCRHITMNVTHFCFVVWLCGNCNHWLALNAVFFSVLIIVHYWQSGSISQRLHFCGPQTRCNWNHILYPHQKLKQISNCVVNASVTMLLADSSGGVKVSWCMYTVLLVKALNLSISLVWIFIKWDWSFSLQSCEVLDIHVKGAVKFCKCICTIEFPSSASGTQRKSFSVWKFVCHVPKLYYFSKTIFSKILSHSLSPRLLLNL